MMSSSTEDRIQALEVALNNESREKDFYLSHADRTTNSLGKLMFASIAGDEDEHYRRILTLHRRLREEGKWPETVPLEVEGTKVKDILTKFVKSAKTSSQAERDDLEAVKIAIEFETKGELFYGDLAQKVDNPMEKKFYEFLASIEREHRLSLEDTMEFFQDPAGWYRIKEKLHVDGA
jgi:rubrerythrin